MDIINQLQKDGIVSDSVASSLIEKTKRNEDNLESLLIDVGVSEAVLRDRLASYYDVPAFTFDKNTKIPFTVLKYIPEDSARHYNLIPLKVEDDIITIGANKPDDFQIKEVLNFISAKHNLTYKIVFLLKSDLDEAFLQYESLSGEVSEVLTELQQSDDATKEKVQSKKRSVLRDADDFKEDAPVTKIVGTILRYAVDGDASDIHIEPNEKKVSVRFRVDGSLEHSLELPIKTHPALVARIKILGSMRLDEKRKPQDGRFSAHFDSRKIDFRVSILPTNHGEKVVMRILDNESGVTSLEETGISSYHLETLRRVINEPYGIILVSGPTGSGKSTTLYTLLSEIDKKTKNVLSLEDPVEYNIDGVSQSQMRPEIGYTFAEGLRTALRQDPDIIMVGEIRDRETAQLAIQAALTGHLVLSTIHTNNSIGVVPRLVDMGIDPYLIAPTLKLAVAQRLSKTLYNDTGIEKPVDPSTRDMIEQEFSTLPERYRHRIPAINSIKHPEPSPGCATGLRGRVAVMETLEFDEEMQSLVLRSASEEEIYKHARKNGFMSIKEDAIIKALKHQIPYEEMAVFGTKVGMSDSNLDIERGVDNLKNNHVEEV